MTETYHEAGQYSRRQQQQHRRESRGHQMIKAATAATAGGLLLIMSGLTLAATVIALTVATPALVIFSPVLVPAMMTVFFLVTGLLASGGFGVAGVTVLGWMYRYVSSGRERDGGYDRKVQVWRGREREEHGGKGHHATGGVRMTTGARTGLFQQG